MTARDELFERACDQLRTPSGTPPRWWVLPVTAVLFLAGARLVSGWRDVLVVVAVVAVHELGHYVAMMLVGYRDVRMFFLPFLGAATTGTREDAEAWQRAVVALAGPVPGIAAALLLALVLPDQTFSQWDHAVGALLLINGFNLLPIEPLDGGRVMSTLLFSRLQWVEALFGLGSGATLIVLGATLQVWVLLGIGVLLVLVAPGRYRLRTDAIAVARRIPSLCPRIQDNTEPALFALFLQAMRQLHGVAATPQAIVTRMRAIHQRAVQRPASPGAVAVWLAAYGLAVAGTVLAGALVLARQARPG